ncbi:hypothetical protein [Paenibacillus sp. N3.4]|uniref:hypothetical protein n=1 Tax=Paenibacillus sp. N3.4 TaxID=2603222 RepID=UPI0011CB4919|nr:hypothetical protein [Paenibacillus sp. N3.4]TXK80048.1 hypothetical protein FU659_18975 [Paenibacillus sp. N3.4]
MSKKLANLYLFCENNKESSKQLKITSYANGIVVTQLPCELFSLEIAPFETLDVIIDNGQRVLSFMIQDCSITYDNKIATVIHLEKMYLTFEFTE